MKTNSNQFRVLLAILGGLLLWVSWPPLPFPFFLFVGFFPLFVIEKQLSNVLVKQGALKYFGYAWLSFLVWNVCTTYWIYYATASGGVGPAAAIAWMANALFQALPFLGYYRIKRRFNQRIAYLALISFWLCYEWIHFSWELAWPWLALGNGFATTTELVQWYSWTGVSGGSFWILLINILIFEFAWNQASKKKTLTYVLPSLLIPMAVSLFLYFNYDERGEGIEISIVQPNVDPYLEQSNATSNTEITSRMVSLARNVSSEDTDYIVFPETSLPNYLWKDKELLNSYVQQLLSLFSTSPNARIVIGVDYFEHLGREKKTATARYSPQGKFYFDVYNAALEFTPEGNVGFYGKSKLVPGVERMPYPEQLRFLEKLVIDLGGASGSRATQKERTVFVDGAAKIAPAICYESVFGDYINEFTKNGANLLFIITNDGWWKDSPGYKQHFLYSKLRAVENRRDVARSANTGISAYINQRGDVIHQTQWWTEDSFSATLFANDKLTLYAKYGDVFYRIGMLMTIIILLISIVKRYTKNFLYRS